MSTNSTQTTRSTNTTNGSNGATGAPAGWSPVTCQLPVDNVQDAAAFYQRLGFALESFVPNAEGEWFWATLRMGTSRIFVTDHEWGVPTGRSAPTGRQGFGGAIYCHVPNVDSVFNAFNRVGPRPEGTVQETFWGDRAFTVTDPYGYRWSFATHVRDVPPNEIADAALEH